MFKYLLLLQVVRVYANNEFFSWEIFPSSSYLEGNLGMFNNIPVVKNTTSSEDKYIIQTLNHFDQADVRKWRHRYFVNDEYYKPSGPIFLMISTNFWSPEAVMKSGAWIQYAKRFGAMCFGLEHRYYGNSWPTSDLSTENLEYLNSQQALADAASFITEMNVLHRFSEDVKWIAFGGEYSGSLAAWLRLKYPHLVHGAVSSSAPLIPRIDFADFYGIVGEALGSYKKECDIAVQEALIELNTLVQDYSGQQQVKKLLWFCERRQEPAFTRNDVANVNNILASWFADSVLRNGSTYPSIGYLCDKMINQTLGTPLHRFAAYLNDQPKFCILYKYVEKVQFMQNVDWDSFSAVFGVRQWQYQTCTEFGFFKTFGSVPLDFFEQMCFDVFGPEYNWNALYDTALSTYIEYGGTDIDVTNVVFVQGSQDPWYPLGVAKDINSKAPAIFITGASHCADMTPESANDSAELKAAREKIVTYIETWLKE